MYKRQVLLHAANSPLLWVARPLQLLTLLLPALYAVAFYRSRSCTTPGAFLSGLLAFLMLSMGLSLHNTLAVAEGWLGRQSSFVRTPKFNVTAAGISTPTRLTLSRLNMPVLAEALLCMYFAGCGLQEVNLGLWGLVPFHVLTAAGFGWVAVASLMQARPAA